MKYLRDDAGHSRIATLDIETTHYEAEQGETVSIGLGAHDRGTHGEAATYTMLHRKGDDEAELTRRAFRELDDLDADVLVSYKGHGFDIKFLKNRLQILGESADPPELDTREAHVDIYADRKQRADQRGKKWPKLEECLASYGLSEPTTIWNGEEVTNIRFGEELGPAYLNSLNTDDDEQREALTDVIEHYLVTDLEANLALYYSDIGETFDSHYLGDTQTFST